jgi:hypothetical protein
VNDELLRLAERCEAATGPDRHLDVHIAATLFPKRFGDKRSAEIYRTHRGGYNCADREHLADIAPRVTASLDAATTLVPEGWYWRAGHGVLWPGWAHLNRKHPDHCDRDDEHSAHAETPALALCAAALRSHAHRMGEGE